MRIKRETGERKSDLKCAKQHCKYSYNFSDSSTYALAYVITPASEVPQLIGYLFDFKLEHEVLAVKPLSGTNTGENIAKELNAVADCWDIERAKIHLVIYDSRNNAVKDVRIAEDDSIRCFIHTLQKAIAESLKVQPEVTTMIAGGRRLIMHFNQSGLAREKLLAIQKDLNLIEH
ncbi:Zinc finger BED domain-containing protein 4 [Eumeta japonica]|uniref:Zinc finger BED domain-containing protein 4 n=1 Tax=Eumeta variegata TaxID=151549 RepID=A0A4C1Y9E1_EUMVA|nr:Zinc finger BED domain-containing protein 4 [Eumeta japonica]